MLEQILSEDLKITYILRPESRSKDYKLVFVCEYVHGKSYYLEILLNFKIKNSPKLICVRSHTAKFSAWNN